MAGVPFNVQFAHIKQETDALRALIDQLAGPQSAAKANSSKAADAPQEAEASEELAPARMQSPKHEKDAAGGFPEGKTANPIQAEPVSAGKAKSSPFFMKAGDIRRAVIMSEILSPPVSRRK